MRKTACSRCLEGCPLSQAHFLIINNAGISTGRIMVALQVKPMEKTGFGESGRKRRVLLRQKLT